MVDKTNLNHLKSEYSTIIEECADHDGEVEWDALTDRLAGTAEWTPSGAEHLARLVQDYGSFVLRNAAALAIAAQIEDGRLGL